MSFFEKLFGKFHVRTYRIEVYAECKEYLTKHDVFFTTSNTCIYNAGEGYLEVGADYIAKCKTLTRTQYETIIQTGSVRNPYFIANP